MSAPSGEQGLADFTGELLAQQLERRGVKVMTPRGDLRGAEQRETEAAPRLLGGLRVRARCEWDVVPVPPFPFDAGTDVVILKSVAGHGPHDLLVSDSH